MLNYVIQQYIAKACEQMHCECSIITGSENFFNESVTDTKCTFGTHLIFFIDPIKETIQDGISSGKVFMRVVLLFADIIGEQELYIDGEVIIESIIRELTSREVDESIDSKYRIMFGPVEYKQFVNYSDDCAFGYSLSFDVKTITSVC